MIFYATYRKRGEYDRRAEFDAHHGAHAQALAERDLREDETLVRVMLASRVTVDPAPIMPSDHARNVAEGRRS